MSLQPAGHRCRIAKGQQLGHRCPRLPIRGEKMPVHIAPPAKSGSWPITVAATGIAAAQFARCGFDFMIQAGPDKPGYDLVVTKGGNLLKISVKASEDGRWRLAESYMQRAASANAKKPDIPHAIRMWLDTHGERTVYCLVQFEGVSLNQLPRIYLATPGELAHRMKESVERIGEAELHEQYEWTSPESGFTAIEALPSAWLFSMERIHELLFPQAAQSVSAASVRTIGSPSLQSAVMTA